MLLNELLQSEKDKYVIYEHYDVDHFFQTIDPSNISNVNTEMQNLQAFLDNHKGITGLTVKPDIQVSIQLFV